MTAAPRPVVAPPSTVTAAYRLYLFGALLGVVVAVLSYIAVPGQLQQGIDEAQRSAQGSGTEDAIRLATGAAITGIVIGSVLALAFTVLTVVFALKFREGRNWARIVLAVFAGLQVFGVLGAYGVGALHFLVVLAALVLSFLAPSNRFFRAADPRAQAY